MIIKIWIINWLLRSMTKDSGLVSHAERELGDQLKDGGPAGWIARDTLQLVRLFSTHGHSGSTAPFGVGMFSDLAMYKTLGPLTGKDDEWGEAFDEEGTQQNKRCSHVFKNADGETYDSEGRIFREPDGSTFTRHGTELDSSVPVRFPYTPTRKYVDVPFDREEEACP